MNAPLQQFLNKGQVEVLIQGICIGILGLQPTSTDGFYKVRVSWQPTGAPDWKQNEDILFIRAEWADDQYDRIREKTLYPDPSDDTKLIQSETYTRVWRIAFVFYGPNGLDKTRKILHALFSEPVHDSFAASHLYMIPDIGTPQRVPEEFTSIWWERVDFSVNFNEAVVELTSIPIVENVPVKVYDSASFGLDNPIINLTVEA